MGRLELSCVNQQSEGHLLDEVSPAQGQSGGGMRQGGMKRQIGPRREAGLPGWGMLY